MDAEQFDGLARTVAERDEERARDREQFATLTRLVAKKGTRRLALAGLLAGVLQGLRSQPTAAQCRAKEGKERRQCRRRERDDRAPGAGACQEKLFGLCTVNLFNPDANPCCNSMECVGTIAPFVTACQYLCDTDGDCKRKFPNKALVCREDVAVCPLRGKCCVPRL